MNLDRLDNLLSNEYLGQIIIDELNKVETLPDKGIIAGGAPVAILYKILTGHNIKFNDIDIFEQTNDSFHSVDRTFDSRDVQVGVTLLQSYGDFSYGNEVHYRILRVKSKENSIINTITIDYYSQGSPKSKYKTMPDKNQEMALAIIEGFDFNCTQVAVDLETREIIIHENFREFLKTGQIEIVNVHTPFHSMLRFFKKARTFPCTYANFEETVRMVSNAIMVLDPEKYSSCISESTYNKFIDEIPKLDDYFSIYKVRNTIMPTDDKYVWVITPTKYIELSYPELKIVQDNQFGNISLFHSIWKFYTMPGVSQNRRKIILDIANQYPMVAKLAYAYPDFIDCIPERSLIKRIVKFFEEHIRLLAVYTPKTLSSMIRYYQQIQFYIREYGEFVVGSIENFYVDKFDDNGIIDTKVVEYFKKEQLEGSIELNYRLPITSELISVLKAIEPSVEINERLTGNDLRIEGNEMHHCVGGYNYAVQRGDSRIISFKTNGVGVDHRSTLELGIDITKLTKKVFYKDNQHRSFTNADPGPTHQKLKEAFIKYVNNNRDYQIKPVNYEDIYKKNLNKATGVSEDQEVEVTCDMFPF